MGWFNRYVLVTLIDDASDAPFAKTKMPPGDLPESFEIETTLHLDGTDWFVVHAEPQTRSEYTESRTLTLRLRKIETMPTDVISYSQLDITEGFGDNLKLSVDDWMSTTPLNSSHSNPESVGLPSPSADVEEVYEIACKLSRLRESIPIPSDGVYCPICHIANIELGKLRTPCPRCGRELLKFGWD